MPTIAIATDEPVAAAGLTSVLSSVTGFSVLAVFSPEDELPPAVFTAMPDLLIYDGVPGINFKLLARVREACPSCKMVLWVRSGSAELTFSALELGIYGILSKTLPVERLLEALTDILSGRIRFDLAVGPDFGRQRRIQLSSRERDIIRLLCEGLSNKEIAARLQLREGTVKVYLSRIFEKAKVKDRFELALFGLRSLPTLDHGFLDLATSDRRRNHFDRRQGIEPLAEDAESPDNLSDSTATARPTSMRSGRGRNQLALLRTGVH